MGGGKGGGGGQTSQTSTTTIPPQVLARYEAVNARAEDVAKTPWEAYGGEFVAPVNATQQGGINTIAGAAGSDDPSFTNANGTLTGGLNQANPLFQTGVGQIAGGLAAGQGYTAQGVNTAGAATAGAQPYAGLATGQLNNAYGTAQSTNNAALDYAKGATGAVNPGALDINRYMSPYNESVVQSTLGNLRQQQTMDQNDLRDGMIMGGSFGGDRSGVAAANLKRQQDMAYGNVAAGLYDANYRQGLGAAQQQQGVGLSAGQANRAALASGAQTIAGVGAQQFGQGAATAQGNLGIGSQLYQQGQGLAAAQMQGGNQLYQQGVGAAGANANLASGIYGTAANAATTGAQLGTQQMQNDLAQGQAQIGAGTVQQQTKQAQDSAVYQQFLQQKGYPFQVAQFLANIAMGTGAQSGSTTTTVGNPSQPYFSDPRLKEDMEEIGRTHDGQPIYRYRMKGSPNTQIGLSADEVSQAHPEAVGLHSGYKTVDYKGATDAAVRKAGGGGLSAGNDNFAQLLAQQRAMYPYGGSDARGISSGTGPHGISLAPMQSRPVQAHKVNLAQPKETGFKRDVDNVTSIYGLGKGLAGGYGDMKDAVVGSAATPGKNGDAGTPASGGLLGTGGKWDPSGGWLGRQFEPSTTSGGITTSPLPAIEANGVAAPNVTVAGLGWDPSNSSMNNFYAARGGRIRRAFGGGALPYGEDEGYIPSELYKPVDPKAPEGDKPGGGQMGGQGGRGGQIGGGAGKAAGALIGTGLGAMFGMPMLGSMAGGLIGGLFNEGGRVGMADGGIPGEVSPDEDPQMVRSPVPFTGHRSSAPALNPEAVRLTEVASAERSSRAAQIAAKAVENANTQLVGSDTSPARSNVVPFVLPQATVDTIAANERPAPPAGGLAAPPMAVPTAVTPPASPPAAGLATPPAGASYGPSQPTIPDHRPDAERRPLVDDDRPTTTTPPPGQWGPEGLATPPAASSPVGAPPAAPTPATGLGTPPGTQQARSMQPYDPSTYPSAVFGNESNGRDFNNPRFPIAQGGPDGPGGFIPGTWNEFVKARPELFQGMTPEQINAARRNGPIAAEATNWYAKKNSGPLQAAGVPLTNGTLYMAHMLDGPGAAAILSRPDVPAVEALMSVGIGRDYATKMIVDNGGDPRMTGGAFARLHMDRMDGKSGARPQTATALNGPAADPSATALATPPATKAAADPTPVPDFIDRAGNWIDRNQRHILGGLSFIGNMLGSKSYSLAGSIGEGLAAAAPQYLASGFKETEQKQRQEQIDITARAQYMTVLNQLRAQQAAHVSTTGRPDPAIDAEIAKVSALITAKGGVSAAGARTGATPPAAQQRPGAPTQGIPAPTNDRPGSIRTDLLPPPPAGGPGATTTMTPAPQVRPGEAPNKPTDPYAMPTINTNDPSFKAQIHPEMDPDVWLEKARANATNSPEQSAKDYAKANQLREQLKTTGQTLDKNNQVLWVPGWREAKAADARQEPNRVMAEQQQQAANQRQVLNQQLTGLKTVINDFETGALKEKLSTANAYLADLGLPQLGSNRPEDYQKFMKEASKIMLSTANSMPAGGATDALRSQIQTAFANPALTPEANRKIVADTDALLRWNDKYYTDLTKQLEKTPWLDARQYYDDWAKANPLEKYTKESNRDITAKGMDVPKSLGDLEDGRRYTFTPQQVFSLYSSHPDEAVRKGIRIEDIKKQFNGKGTMTMRVVKQPDGSLKLVPE